MTYDEWKQMEPPHDEGEVIDSMELIKNYLNVEEIDWEDYGLSGIKLSSLVLSYSFEKLYDKIQELEMLCFIGREGHFIITDKK